MDVSKYRYVCTDHRPPQVWMHVNCLWGRCWCGKPRELFVQGRRVHCSKMHADWWQEHICSSWSAVRGDVLERDLHVCQMCGMSSQHLDIDHIIPKSLGGNEWHPDNLQALCRTCHEAKTLQDNRLFLSHRRSEGVRCITDWIG